MSSARHKSVVREYQDDLLEILETGVGYFLWHATGRCPEPYCVLTDEYQELVQHKTNKFMRELRDILQSADAIPQGQYAATKPEEVDVSAILDRISNPKG